MLALLMILPHTIISYSRQKRINVRWETYIYGFVLYLICAYFMTMLPLPSEGYFDVIPPLRDQVQLIPFKCFFETNLLRSPVASAVIIFNLFLTVPLGIFLRFLFGFKFGKTLLSGFAFSLLCEITQITGLFFIYPAPYRIFDVDDLIINTLGAVVGYLIFPLISRVFPKAEDTSHQVTQGSEASFFQRCAATASDIVMIFIISTLLIVCVPPIRTMVSGSYTLLRIPIFLGIFIIIGALYSFALADRMLGYKLTGLKLLQKGGKRVSRPRAALRSVVIYSFVVGIPLGVTFLLSLNTEYAGMLSVLWVLIGAILMVCAAAIILEMMFNAVTHGSSMVYDRIFDTYVAYSKSRKSSVFGIRVIDICSLESANSDMLSDEIYNALLDMKVPHESATKVRLMAEGVMLDWIEQGLGGTPCELRLDKRYKGNALMLSVSGEDKTNDQLSDGYTQMLKGLDLSLTTYYAAEKNICNIIVP
jgi:glycopeptide antibiotics resistance protein